jgi:hypothetical protein
MWSLIFAWLPVYVDAYHVDEIRNGKMHYRVWLQYVERREDSFTDEDGFVVNRIRYRLVRKIAS